MVAEPEGSTPQYQSSQPTSLRSILILSSHFVATCPAHPLQAKCGICRNNEW